MQRTAHKKAAIEGPLITPGQIQKLLATKHSRDVFVPECKNGPTQYAAGMLKMDAWAMTRSWTNPLVTAYEVKVARSDFLNDEKWHGYLAYCNEFYFVCPSGVIERDELPPEVGLMYVSKTGTRLFKKKKAPRRAVVIPDDIWRYLLMCRATMRPDYDPSPGDRQAFLRKWLTQAAEDRELGIDVGRAVAATVREVRRENSALKVKIQELANVKALCERLGLDPHTYNPAGEFERQLKGIRQIIPDRVLYTIRRGAASMADTVKAIEAHLQQLHDRTAKEGEDEANGVET